MIENNNEIWENVKDYEGLYQVSNLGNVKNIRTNKILKQSPHHRGHLRVGLSKNGKTKMYRVHRLVADAFIPNTNNYPVVNHINGNMKDNRVENLEWCTQKYNCLQASKTSSLKEQAVVGINKKDGTHIYFQNIHLAEEYLKENGIEAKLPRVPIIDVCNERLKSAYGFYWIYVDKIITKN